MRTEFFAYSNAVVTVFEESFVVMRNCFFHFLYVSIQSLKLFALINLVNAINEFYVDEYFYNLQAAKMYKSNKTVPFLNAKKRHDR